MSSSTQYPNLQEYFLAIADQYAAEIALELPDSRHTYADLLCRARMLASYLSEHSINTDDVIGIVSTKVFDDYAMMIACILSGVAYTNLDIDNPAIRTQNICETCLPKLLFCAHTDFKIPEGVNIPFINYDDINTKDSFIPAKVDKITICYVMFTSGSTGKPKGAAITHGNLLNFIAWSTTRYDVKVTDNFANISPMYFDNSVFDFFTALFSGASLTPVSKELLNKPLEMVQYVEQKQCTIWFSVPSMLIYLLTMRVLNKDSLLGIRVFTFGGEGFPKTELQKLYNFYGHRSALINVYGPTECTCICSSYTITDDDFENLDELPSLGTMNAEFGYHFQDGELCLTGPNVGPGYYNDPERTKEVFSNHDGDAMYRTGDLVEEREGLLYFKGRVDNQIKHMGYRIELEEIEIALNALTDVKQAAVIYHRASAGYGKIIAFIMEENDDFDLVNIKRGLEEKLPAYMQPNQFQICESFPKNANGKIDKKQLTTSLN